MWPTGTRAAAQGYSAQEVIGQPLANFSRPRTAPRAPRGRAGLAARDGKFTGEGWRCRKDGSRFWAHVTIERIHDANGRAVGFAKITRDMTEWKANQDHLTMVRKPAQHRAGQHASGAGAVRCG
jgi:PAS domain S-box-containing protein